VQPVQLPARRNTLTDYTGQLGRFAGWGSMSGSAYDIIPVERLQSAQTLVISSFNCGRDFPFPILSSLNICTARGGPVPCHVSEILNVHREHHQINHFCRFQGDDGGGLTVTTAGGVEVLIGLISYTSFTNCSPTIPAIYTRIPAVVFLNWIAENTDVIIES
jgi:hypothetical protein